MKNVIPLSVKTALAEIVVFENVKNYVSNNNSKITN